MAGKSVNAYARPLSKRQQAIKDRQRRRQRRRIWRLAQKGVLVLGIVGIAAVLVYAYRESRLASDPAPGDMVTRPAPDFSLPQVDGGETNLSSYYGKKNVLLFFNEGYGCAPCWQQAVELQEDMGQFASMNTEVFAVMVDPPNLLKSEASRWGLRTLPILVDESRKVSKSYDALGGMHADKPNHTFVLISADGRVLWDADYPSMRVSREAVVQQVRALLAQ